MTAQGGTLRSMWLRAPPQNRRAIFLMCYGPEFIAKAVQDWIAAVGSTTASIEPGSPWENGYCESLNAKLRDELLDGKVFDTLKEASVVIEPWRRHDNSIRPHSSLSDQPPAPEVILWPTEPNGSVPTARPAIVTQPTMHELRTWTTR
jgi:putative transposase